MINGHMREISQWIYSYLLFNRTKGAVLMDPLSHHHLLCLSWSSSPPFSLSNNAHQFSSSLFTFFLDGIVSPMFIINIFLVTIIPFHLYHSHILFAQAWKAHLSVKAVVKLMINLGVGCSFIQNGGPNRKLARFPAHVIGYQCQCLILLAPH